MRVTVVTETYLPQVNGVSRTLGQLVRHLLEVGDSVQLIHPRYDGAPSTSKISSTTPRTAFGESAQPTTRRLSQRGTVP